MRHPGLSTFLAGTAAVTTLSLVNSQNITESCQTIPEYLCSPSRRSFSVLCRLLEDTGLDEALLEPELTLFAPTNEAFRRFGLQSDDQIAFFATGGGRATMMEILLFHVAQPAFYEMDLNCTAPLEMLNGDISRTKCPSANTKQQSGASNIPNSEPSIVVTDIEACEGSVIHAVNNVMLP